MICVNGERRGGRGWNGRAVQIGPRFKVALLYLRLFTDVKAEKGKIRGNKGLTPAPNHDELNPRLSTRLKHHKPAQDFPSQNATTHL